MVDGWLKDVAETAAVTIDTLDKNLKKEVQLLMPTKEYKACAWGTYIY